MPQLNQGQVGALKSTPKLTRINGDDSKKVIYRNLGNNHAYPFIWATTTTISGTSDEVVLAASGISWHGYALVDYANITVTPTSDPDDKHYYVEKNTTTGVIKLKTTAAVSMDVTFDVKWMLGDDEFSAEGLYCRGNHGAAQSLP